MGEESTASGERSSYPRQIGRQVEFETTNPPPGLEKIVAQTEALGFNMASEPRTGAFLRVLAASKPAGHFLELGTGTGIATAWILAGMDSESKLTSVDVDERVQSVAQEFLGGDSRLSLVLEDGLAFLARQPEGAYDFVFADAMPGKYEGMEACLRVVKPGGIYVVDDLLPQENWPAGHAEKVPVLLRNLMNHASFETVTLAWASGLAIAVKHAGQTS